jgi:hypothetical protein
MERTVMKTLLALMLACSMCSAQAYQSRGSTLSDASEVVAFGSVLAVMGGMSAVAASGDVVVSSVETVGEVTTVALKSASRAATVTLQLSGRTAHGASVVAGTAVSVTAIASGYILAAAGEVICFIPNELGKSMLHHSPSGRS